MGNPHADHRSYKGVPHTPYQIQKLGYACSKQILTCPHHPPIKGKQTKPTFSEKRYTQKLTGKKSNKIKTGKHSQKHLQSFKIKHKQKPKISRKNNSHEISKRIQKKIKVN
jgi:hypothetical protein